MSDSGGDLVQCSHSGRTLHRQAIHASADIHLALTIERTQAAHPLVDPGGVFQALRIAGKNIGLIAVHQGKLRTCMHTGAGAVGGILANTGLMLGAAMNVRNHTFIGLLCRCRWCSRRLRRGNGGYTQDNE